MEKRHFFISRSGADRQYAQWVCAELARQGYSYHEQGQWPPGSNFVNNMSAAIEASEYMLAFFSRHYFAPESEFTNAEWTAVMAYAKSGHLVGIRIDDVEVPSILRPRTYIDVMRLAGEDEKMELILAELEKLRVQLPRSTGEWKPPLHGSRRGRMEIRALPALCDRETEELELWHLLEARPEGRPVIVVVHGDEEQAPELFRKRVEKVSLPRRLASSGDPRIRGVFVPWPPARDVAELRRALMVARNEHMLAGYAPEDAIVVGTDLLVEPTFGPEMRTLLEEYVRFWCTFDAGRGCTVVVCVSVRYRTPRLASWWRLRRSNRAVREAVEALAAAAQTLGCTVVGPVKPVPRSEVEHWARLPAVAEVAAIETDDIAEIYDRAGDNPIPMRTLTPVLQQLLQQKAHARNR